MSSRSPRPAAGRRSRRPDPEDSYPHIPEPKQGHAGHLLAFLSVLAVLGFGVWTAFATLVGPTEKPAPKAVATLAPTAAATAAPSATPGAATPTPAGTPAPSGTAAPGGARVHVIVSGDTLYAIAQRYRTTVDALMAANGITDRNKPLRVGDRLTLP